MCRETKRKKKLFILFPCRQNAPIKLFCFAFLSFMNQFLYSTPVGFRSDFFLRCNRTFYGAVGETHFGTITTLVVRLIISYIGGSRHYHGFFFFFYNFYFFFFCSSKNINKSSRLLRRLGLPVDVMNNAEREIARQHQTRCQCISFAR